MGTPAYISPEQARAQTVDQRSDIYSLGVILYEMVTGRVPFTADTPLAVILMHVSDPLPLPSILKPDIPEPIERVILKALAKEPGDRYSNATEFLAAWKRALEDVNTVRHTPEKILPPVSPASRPIPSAPAPKAAASSTSTRPTGLIIGCVIGACLLLAVGGIAVFGSQMLPFLNPKTATPLPTKTFTPTPIPPTQTLVPTAIPTSNALLKDDFSSKNWGTLNETDDVVEYDNEALRMKVFKKNWFVWSTPNSKTYKNVHTEVTVTNNDGESTTAFGIMCDQQDTTSNYYYLAMTPGGEYTIALAAGDKTDVFLTNNDQWASSDLIKKNASSYRVGADCGNGTLTLYVDGQRIDSVSDNTYGSGSVGAFVWSGENVTHADVSFDDFILTSLK
jgi:serine/threonine protein kinase